MTRKEEKAKSFKTVGLLSHQLDAPVRSIDEDSFEIPLNLPFDRKKHNLISITTGTLNKKVNPTENYTFDPWEMS